jgi:hypothetical protein
LALLVKAILERWYTGVGACKKRCPIVWDIKWSNTKMIKIQYTVAFIGRQ